MIVRVGEKSAQETFDRLAQIAREETFLLSDIWHRSRQQFGPSWVDEVADNVIRLFGPEEEGRWEEAIRGYAEFSRDSMRHQEFLEAHGRYRRSTLVELQQEFYENELHMMRHYLPGMLLSHYLWPHHFKLLTFFRQHALAGLPSTPELFYDVGIGTGLYSREILRAFPRVRGKGFDISPHSATFTGRLLQAYGLADRYDVALGDVLQREPPERAADFVVSQEVLEHLEDPRRFVAILRRMTRPGGRAYITAAINAGLSDHIYLFRSPEEVRSLLTEAGWKILGWQAEYAYDGTPIEWTPCVAAFFCEREP